MNKVLLFFIFTFFAVNLQAQQVAVLKYGGGGDWYSNPTAVPNLIQFSNENIKTSIDPQPGAVEPGSTDIFQYPLIFMTGHGNVFFSDEDALNLRNYLLGGGFLHIDDNYGMNEFIRRELKKVFPEKELEELPASHPIFSAAFNYPNGLPKIHGHDGLRPQAFGIFENGRLLCLFTFETDLSDGWEDPQVHNDPEEVRLKALQMGANIVKFAFSN
ncbi:DUF4159 domain-containing protein [Salinimicrobium sediminilitoris]|uniref:DUF4159 domain-containing protein n=1 Tax=Salinimicrobium sediminilitoris TaxID=2876715 RepID=UPI001E2B2E76|nr:DUF4159 domain-containing protein [Salinimicrobium sediminilitoris]MCC8358708.1 DUF4159 domain-containing protein [Salinimicrobium sediminilitoris]